MPDLDSFSPLIRARHRRSSEKLFGTDVPKLYSTPLKAINKLISPKEHLEVL